MPTTHLRGYDNSKRLVLGTIFSPINVGPIERNMKFQVLDIPNTFNIFSGYPWIQAPSSAIYSPPEDEDVDKRAGSHYSRR